MVIRTHNVIKSNAKNQLHVQHTTNAKYKKYLHQGYKIQQGQKCVVLKIMQQNLKVLKNATKQGYKNKVLNIN